MYKYLLISAVVFAASYGQILLKKSVASQSSINFNILLNLDFIIGVGLYGFCSIAWLYILKSTPLSQAYPYLALTFVIVPLFSRFFLGEMMSYQTYIGCGIILFGLILITAEL
jgi:drug/metabolite transporter (DMT)-like permease